MKHLLRILLAAAICLTILPLVQAQSPEVYVTTQDQSALRIGPGRSFEQVATVPHSTTLRAIGRTLTADWVQVEYEGQQGWIASWLLIWTGDILALPIDTIAVAFARRSGPLATTTKDTPIYPNFLPLPEERLGTLPAGTRVEITGRFGSGSLIWLQFNYNGEYYWAGNWNFDLRSAPDVPNAALFFAYGRLLNRTRDDFTIVASTTDSIGFIWRSLQSGQAVSCNVIPAPIALEPAQNDLLREPIFTATARALEIAALYTNSAIERFRTACQQRVEGQFISIDMVNAALEDVYQAELQLTYVRALLPGLTERDPALGGSRPPEGSNSENVDESGGVG